METIIISTLFVLGQSFAYRLPHAAWCGHDWWSFEDSCYKFIERKVDWYEARLICRKFGSHLVRIETGEEDEFVAQIARHFQTSTWIGLTGAMVEGHYVWEDNKRKPVYKHWMRGQPNNYWKSEDCTYLSRKHHYLWSDAPCDNSYSSICEKQAPFIV